ncbi:response regulator [Flavobacterium humi]|uniref:Response regulator transcription factor n=1 Tax=Flavobacterium humi TaxID=2562683 RepID=A0A4Z0L9V1_9FLAO|nr:response regulator [Flavobacterium humi]TGD58840.1 response regulator transcription factor [Flavobacterium humi]
MKKIDLTYILDDDNIFIFVLMKLLAKNENFNRVLEFKNGKDLLETLTNSEGNIPNVILLDINMPVLDGWQFLEKLEAMPNKDHFNVFIMTSSIDANDIEKSKLFSTVKDFISKPINKEKLDRLLDYF